MLLAALSIIAISVVVLLSVSHLRDSAKKSFNGTISGIDLIVGPRSSDLNLLLTSVFRLGTPSQNMSWQSDESLSKDPNIAWSIPIALGDSHRGFRVVVTQDDFFTRYQYGSNDVVNDFMTTQLSNIT